MARDLVVERNPHFCKCSDFVSSFKRLYEKDDLNLLECWHLKSHFEEELVSNYIIDSFRRTILEEKSEAVVAPLFVVRERKKKNAAPLYS